nr:imidazole glycerol phosphate synthase subunit HisH [Pelomonas sp. P7]
MVDYGVGNLGSIQNMLKKLGAESAVASDIATIERATKLILPGVGAFDAGMGQLNASGLRPALDEAVLSRKLPVAGICLGMQLMTDGSEEGQFPGLGWVPARTTRFAPAAGETMKIPHMGWSVVSGLKPSRALDFLEGESRFYFVHSYHVHCRDREDALLAAQYGSVVFDAAFERENILGFQFHPEKSHRFGMALLKAFLERY